MRLITCSILLMSAAAAASAQQWGFGALGGGGLLNNVPASSGLGAATAGFAPGFATGVFAGQSIRRHFSGEIRYEFMQSNLQLSSGGQSAQFAGAAHALHYDVLFHMNPRESRVQFFAAAGGGVKAFFGTGAEAAFQPLSQFGYFTKTHSVLPMISAGAGFTYRIGPRVYLRSEVRDFMTAFPTAVLTPAPGVKYGSLLHEFVPMVGIEYVR